MLFKDIPKFTRNSNYEVRWNLKQITASIAELNENLLDSEGNVTHKKGLISNPDFQRGHVWTEEQQIKFVEYLFKGGMSGRDIYFNNPSHMESFDEPYVCVDGLQRLTACVNFLTNDLKVFGHYYREFEGPFPNDAYLNIHINDLKTRKEVLQWYLEMNEGGTPHTEEELLRVKEMLDVENN